MKNAFMPLGLAQVLRAASCCIALEIFTSADDSALGRPVTIAAPRSAANSR